MGTATDKKAGQNPLSALLKQSALDDLEVPLSPSAAIEIAKHLAETLDRVSGGPLQRAIEKLLPPLERYQANGVIAGILGKGTITTLDGETFGAELAPVLRKWVEKNPEAAATPSRWIVYPRTVPGGLAFYVLGQRKALPGETEAQLNRQVDRFQVVGVLTNSRGLRKQTCVRICRNELVPQGKKRHPSWRPRFLFLAGLPPSPTKAWWNTDVRIQCQRVGRALKILAIDKVGSPAVARHLEIGPAVLPWPWKPSSQSIWRLCHREDLSKVPPWPGSDAEADQIIGRYLKVMAVLLAEVFPHAFGRQAGRVDPAKRAELVAQGSCYSDLIRQWVAATNRFLEGLGAEDREGLEAAHQLKQRLAMAMVIDFENTLEIEGDRFWFEGWPIRGRAARILRENLPLSGGEDPGGSEVQAAPPVSEWGAKTVTSRDLDELIDALHVEAGKKGWSAPLLHLKITNALDAATS